MKPLIKYRGGKSKEIPYIIRHIPNYTGRYIEPFLGGGALYFYLEPNNAIINDINSKLIAFYNGVKNDYASLRKELDEIDEIYKNNTKSFKELKENKPGERVINGNEELYYQIRGMFNNISSKNYSDALLYYFINKTAYSGMIRYNAKGGFNVPFGRYSNLNTSLVTQEHHELLAGAEIMNTDYRNVFNIAREDDFIFIDPPYDCTFSDYGNEEYKDGFNDENHEQLAQDFRNLNSRALLVIGRTPLTERLYGDLIVDEYAKTYAVNIRNRFKSIASHILVANY